MRSEEKPMKGDYFSEEIVLDVLGGLQQKYKKKKKTIYKLKSGVDVVIRNNAQLDDYYWYNIQRDLFNSNVQCVVCVAGFEGVYCIPINIISKCAEEGHLSLTKNGLYYKLVLQRYSGTMCLRLTNSKEPIAIEQFQV